MNFVILLINIIRKGALGRPAVFFSFLEFILLTFGGDITAAFNVMIALSNF